MTTDREGLARQIDAAAGRLLDTVRRLTDDNIRQPSLLPGWTRGHLLTHVARTGDAMCNLLTWARTGVETPAYVSREARSADIEAGALRTAAELFTDVATTATAFRTATRTLPDTAWHVPVHVLSSAEFPAEQLLVRRLVEVELHHTDLGTGYGPADWPPAFATMDLPEPMLSQRKDRTNGGS
jgi:maleylpyruvate isomerase